MKVFLTGQKGVGKTTCIKAFVEACQIPSCGFLTRPFYEQQERKGFMLHSLCTLPEQDVVFSKQHLTHNEVIPGVFDTFGVAILRKSMETSDRLLILDEIGFLEKEEHLFLETLMTCLDLFDDVLGVLKKYNVEHIEKIKARKDVIILDMDVLSYAKTSARLYQLFGKKSS